MSTKSAAIVSSFTGTLIPSTHGFEITDPMDFKTVTVDGMGADDVINLRRQNFDATDWEPYAVDGKIIQLNTNNTTYTPAKAGVYGLQGVVEGPVTIYTEEVS